MTTVNYTLVVKPDAGTPVGWQVTWGPMQNGDIGVPVDLEGWADRSLQVEGTFGAGGNLEMQGSNDGVNYRVLHDPYSVPLEFTAALGPRITHMTEIPQLMRPAVTAGDGTTSLTLSMFIRRTNR